MRRRTFLGSGLALAAVAGCKSAREVAPAAAPTPAAPLAAPVVSVTEVPLSGLSLMADAVLPGGHGVPGAVQCGVELELALADPVYRKVSDLLRKGTVLLEQRIGPLHRQSPAARLAGLDAAIIADTEFPWSIYRDALLDFTIEAWAGHPSRSGNRDGMVWRALQLPLLS